MPRPSPTRRRPAEPRAATPTSADQQQQSVRRRRRRLWLALLGVSVGWKVIVFTIGAAVPRWLIDDGIEQLPVALQAYGREARVTALALWNGPIERHGLVRTVRVVSAHAGPSYAAADPSAARCGGRHALVRAYTYFGIPYSDVRTTCDRGVVEYRVFRRRKPDAVR